MRRAVYSLLLFLLAFPAFAQTCQTGWSSVQASKIIDLSGNLLASGTFAITGVDANRNIINFGAPGGGAVMKVVRKGPVSNGAIVGTVCVPRSDMATVYVRYHIVVTDNSASGTNAVVIDANDIPITADVFSLDAYPFPANAYANQPNVFTSGQVDGDLHVTGTVYAGTIEGATAANADHATTADTATNANHATSADSATTATTASSASTATNATHATSADSATTATTASALATTPTDCGSEAINGINADGSPKSCIPPGSGGGSSVGAAGTLQAAGTTAGSFAAATTAQVNTALGNSKGLYIFGDSISQGTGASSTGAGNSYLQQAYSYLWQQAVGGTFLLGGTSGDQEADGNYKWIYRVANPQGNGVDPVYGHELGTNDAVNYQGNTNKQAIFQRLALGSLAWLGTPQSSKKFGQSCTLGGGMGNDSNQLLAGLGVVATTNGATASCVISAAKANDSIYACYLIQDSNGGTFTLSIDGTPQTDPFNGTTTWDAYGDGGALIKTQNNPGVTAGVACARFTGFAGGNHTVLFTVTSATSGSNAVWPQWVGVAPVSSTLNPYVIAISPNQQNTGSVGAPYAATYASYINTIVGNLAADGENVSYSDTSNALLNNPSCGNGVQATMFANCYADVIHPNNLGHSVMATTVEASTPPTTLLGATRWNPKQPLQNYNVFAGLTPYQWLDLNPYNNYNYTSGWSPGIKFSGANGQVFGIGGGPAGVTVIAPSGTYGFAACPFGGNGVFPATPPLIANCYLSVKMNGLVDIMGGGTASGMTFQNNLAYTGSNFTLVSNGAFVVEGTHKNGVSSTTNATSSTNSNSPCWYYLGGVWDAIAGTPGFDGPCWQFVPTSPTPAGKRGVGYLTLQPDAEITDIGLDLRNTLLTNHLGTADAITFTAGSLYVGALPVLTPYTLTTSALGGSALAAGACASTTITQTGISGTSQIKMTPISGGPGDGFYWQAWGSASNTIKAQVCAVVAGTPAAQAYNLQVYQ